MTWVGSGSLVLAACSISPTGASNDREAQTVAFYVQAHADDWSLFMSDRVRRSISRLHHVVFIYTTAGDAGREERYWRAREEGVLAATRVLARARGARSCERVWINAHPIVRCTSAKTTSYFLRIPDGNRADGLGFARYGFQSLTALRRGKPADAVDGSTRYASWEDLHTTVGLIFRQEAGGMRWVEVNSHDPQTATNSMDHPDHIRTAEIVSSAAAARCRWSRAWYAGYDTALRRANVMPWAYLDAKAAFDAYDGVMIRNGYGSTYNRSPAYSRWLWRSYARREIAPGKGPCAKEK